jgi:hypothetical protein
VTDGARSDSPHVRAPLWLFVSLKLAAVLQELHVQVPLPLPLLPPLLLPPEDVHPLPPVPVQGLIVPPPPP